MAEGRVREDLTQISSGELFRRRQTILQELGGLELEFNRRREQKRRLIRAEEVQFEPSSNLTPTKIPLKMCRVVHPELGFDIYHFHLFMLEIPPGAQSGKYHRHGDAIKAYLSGRAVEYIGEDEEYHVGPGDFIHIPANVWHGTQNPYDEPVRVLGVQQWPGSYTQVAAPFMDQTVETKLEPGLLDNLPDISSTELYRRRQVFLQGMGGLELELNRRREQKRRMVRSDEIVFEDLTKLSPTSTSIKMARIISPELGFDIYHMHMFMLEIPPGAQAGKYHRHGDAIKHYLSGRAIEYIGDEEYHVGPGDFIHIPANVWHGTQNPYDEPVRVLAVQQWPGTYTQIAAPFMDRTF